MILLYLVVGILFLTSLILNRKKTFQAVKTGAVMFINLLPSFLSILMVIAVVMTVVGPGTIEAWLGGNSGPLAYVIAALTGSVALMPSFVAYPMAGLLVKSGVAYPVIAVFITTLMMVGFLSLPLESKFFGLKVALARNALSLLGALLIGGAMALVWSFL